MKRLVKNFHRRFLPFVFLFLPLASFCAEAPDYPVYVAQVPNPNDYTLFANAGWDGNWYVGYNTCWVKKLPPITPGRYSRAYIGARLGRMKLLRPGKKPWQQRAVPGAIDMALSSTAAWTSAQSFFLTGTEQIPTDGDPENAVETAGESQWFWTEVPIQDVNFKGDNYLALWSPTPELTSVSSSPVLAAGWGGKEIDTWLAKDIKGAPPQTARQALATGLSYFQPAMALKLIPAGFTHPLSIRIIAWRNGTPDHLRPVLAADVQGDSVERAWLECHESGWKPIGRPLWKAPYIFSIDPEELPRGRAQLRVAAVNIWEERSTTPPFTVDVSTRAATLPKN